MFRTIFNQTTAKALLVTGLLVGTMAVRTVPASGQMASPGQFALTPAQQAAYSLATGLSPYERQLLANAVMKLGPQRANVEFTELAQLNVAMPGFLSLVGQRIITPSLQTIPAQYHQLFIDGLLSVTPAEEQFAKQVMSRLGQGAQVPMHADPRLQPFQGFPPSMGTGNSASDGDPITIRDVWKWGHDQQKERNYIRDRGENMLHQGIDMDPVR